MGKAVRIAGGDFRGTVVQGAEQARALDHFFQGAHHRAGRLLLLQLREVDLASGVIQNQDQVVEAAALEPAARTGDSLSGPRGCRGQNMCEFERKDDVLTT